MDEKLVGAIERQLVALKLQIDVALSLVHELLKNDVTSNTIEDDVPKLPKVFGGETKVKHISIAEEE